MTTRALITANGNVGIGTGGNYPIERLDVAGNLRLTGRFLMPGGGNGGINVELTAGTPNMVHGYIGNQVTPGIVGATIAGGGANLNINRVMGNYGTVGGGLKNTAEGAGSTVAGGEDNLASGIQSTIGGGASNLASQLGATVAGGRNNWATSDHAFVGGGGRNRATGGASAISGGYEGTASGAYSTALRGTASGVASLALGGGARAIHDGTFILAESGSLIESTAANQFLVLAPGGVSFWSNSTGTAGVTLSPGAGSWSSASDKEAKENVSSVDGRFLLEKLATIPIQAWNYRAQNPSVRHLGPTAQDFHAAFGLGEDGCRISMVDADGVALAAIQALYRMIAQKDGEIQRAAERLRQLQSEVKALSTDTPAPASQ